MLDKSPQLTQEVDDSVATEENLQHNEWSSVNFFPKPSLEIYKFVLSSFQ